MLGPGSHPVPHVKQWAGPGAGLRTEPGASLGRMKRWRCRYHGLVSQKPFQFPCLLISAEEAVKQNMWWPRLPSSQSWAMRLRPDNRDTSRSWPGGAGRTTLAFLIERERFGCQGSFGHFALLLSFCFEGSCDAWKGSSHIITTRQ